MSKTLKTAKIVTRQRIWLTFAGIMIIALFSSAIVYHNLPTYLPGYGFFNKFKAHLGLDLQGGTHLVYQADMKAIPSGDRASALSGVRDVIERRINAFGVSEPLVQTQSGDRLVVEMAGIKDVNQAIRQIGETPLLEFKEQGEPTTVNLTDQEKAEVEKYNAEALKKAKEITTKALAGQDFASLAKEFSEDTSKDNGGDLGFAVRSKYVAEFSKAIFDDLKIGQITKTPVKSSYGYHIIKKLEEKGTGDAKEVRASHILLKTKSLEAQASGEVNWINTNLSGKNLESATVQFDPNSGQPMVSLQFDGDGKDLFAQITKRNLNKIVGIFLDSQPISLPTVQEEITQGEAVISGNFNIVEAKLLAQRLNAGALPVPIELISQQTVGPALGKIALQKSLLAGMIGLIIVIFFMIFLYRLPGLLASLALVIYALMNGAIVEAWPVTLTLSGIAGFILSIGMAVDANILIFERTKEELRNGKPLGSAIEEGFSRAWSSIKDSNISSLITCLILFWFGSTLIKGFAITLAVGIIISNFSAITITRTFLRLVNSGYLSKHPWLMGIDKTAEAKKD